MYILYIHSFYLYVPQKITKLAQFYFLGMKKLTLIRLLATIGMGIHLYSCQTNKETSEDLFLQYNQPASIWEEALPVGNGRLGAMIFGHPFQECIQVNEESLPLKCV